MPKEARSIPDHPNWDELLLLGSDRPIMKDFFFFFAIHVACILCKHMPFFSEDFGDVIPEHLDYPMSSEMNQRSIVVSICLTFNILST